jgi:hypothetical protein
MLATCVFLCENNQGLWKLLEQALDGINAVLWRGMEDWPFEHKNLLQRASGGK